MECKKCGYTATWDEVAQVFMCDDPDCRAFFSAPDDGLNEDIYFVITGSDDGMVRMGIYLASNGEQIYGTKFPPEVARTIAQNLTMTSWKVEDHMKGNQ